MEKLFVIDTVRPFKGDKIKHTTLRYTEQGKNEYVADIIKKFGKKSIIQIAEYSLVKVTK